MKTPVNYNYGEEKAPVTSSDNFMKYFLCNGSAFDQTAFDYVKENTTIGKLINNSSIDYVENDIHIKSLIEKAKQMNHEPKHSERIEENFYNFDKPCDCRNMWFFFFSILLLLIIFIVMNRRY